MRTILISILIALIVILGGAWAYLLLNGAPKSVADLRKNLFGRSDAIVAAPITPPVVEDIPFEAQTIPLGVPLVKVTERAVAGAVIVTSGSSTVLRYLEMGTGHVYEISLETGTEARISNTTILGATRATWAPSGNRVVIETDTQGSPGLLFLGTISTSTTGFVFDLEGLTDMLDNVAFSQADVLFYTTNESGGTTAWAQNLKEGSVVELFTLPLREIVILWDIWTGKDHYAYTKPAAGFQGFLYRIANGALEKVASGSTLSASRLTRDTFTTTQDGGPGSYSTLLNISSGAGSFMNLLAVKEKCAGGTVLWCAGSGSGAGFPVAWYQGTISYDDSIYRVGTDGVATLELDPEVLSREVIDVTDLSVGPDGRVIFRNKIDDSLWLMSPSGL